MEYTSILRWLAVVSVAITGTATSTSCTDDKPSDNRGKTSAAPSPTRWTSPFTDEQAFAKIPVDGTSNLPLVWRLPTKTDAETTEIVLTARRFRALEFYGVSQSAPDPDLAYLYRHVATDSFVDGVAYQDGFEVDKPDPDPAGGAMWIWVLGVERPSDTEAVVDMCLDYGWYHKRSEPNDIHRGYRAELESIRLKMVAENNAAARWKADRLFASDAERLRPTYGKQCDAWAKHTP